MSVHGSVPDWPKPPWNTRVRPECQSSWTRRRQGAALKRRWTTRSSPRWPTTSPRGARAGDPERRRAERARPPAPENQGRCTCGHRPSTVGLVDLQARDRDGPGLARQVHAELAEEAVRADRALLDRDEALHEA